MTSGDEQFTQLDRNEARLLRQQLLSRQAKSKAGLLLSQPTGHVNRSNQSSPQGLM